MRILSREKGADVLGISSSLLCIIHCLLLPALLLVGNLTDHWHSIDYLFIFLAGVAVYFSARHLRQSFVRVGLWASWLSFSVAILLHEQYAEALYVSLAASLSLAFFHVLSYREKHS